MVWCPGGAPEVGATWLHYTLFRPPGQRHGDPLARLVHDAPVDRVHGIVEAARPGDSQVLDPPREEEPVGRGLVEGHREPALDRVAVDQVLRPSRHLEET